MSEHPNSAEQRIGPFRWRGEWNWKDITERVMSGFLVGATAGTVFWALGRLFSE